MWDQLGSWLLAAVSPGVPSVAHLGQAPHEAAGHLCQQFVQAELLIHKHTVASRLLHYRNRFLSLILISLTVPATLRGCFKLGSTGSPLETPYSSQQLRGLHCLERKKLGDKDIGMLGPYLQSAKWEEKKKIQT